MSTYRNSTGLASLAVLADRRGADAYTRCVDVTRVGYRDLALAESAGLRAELAPVLADLAVSDGA